ncbi:MAG: CGNR zinc finger domain-containing protein [Lysobacterales bacterium]
MKPSPASSRPAPGNLVVVQEFINTLNLETGEDRLADATQMLAWMQEYGLARDVGAVSGEEHRRVLRVREALRSLLLANTRGAPTEQSLADLNEIARTCPLRLTFDQAGTARAEGAGRGIDGALGTLFGTVFEAMANGTWPRLKACLSDDCHWVFYDHSKNRSGTWCSMAVCGSRLKTRAYRRRQAARRT